jgi:hypothetical protein
MFPSKCFDDELIVSQKICKESLHWRQFKHRNVLQLLGVTVLQVGENLEQTCIVSPWMKNSSLMNYVASPHYHPEQHKIGLVRSHTRCILHVFFILA